MAQNITLEEAAAKLGITPEEMKKRLKTDPEFKRLSQIRDGNTIRFKLAAIEPDAPAGGAEIELDTGARDGLHRGVVVGTD
jgi:hypothetical protein